MFASATAGSGSARRRNPASPRTRRRSPDRIRDGSPPTFPEPPPARCVRTARGNGVSTTPRCSTAATGGSGAGSPIRRQRTVAAALGGLATIADVWLNGAHLLHSENMFLGHECEIDQLQPENELCIRFAALEPGARTAAAAAALEDPAHPQPEPAVDPHDAARAHGRLGRPGPRRSVRGDRSSSSRSARPRASSSRRSMHSVRAAAVRSTCARRSRRRAAGERALARRRPSRVRSRCPSTATASQVVGNAAAGRGRAVVAAYARRATALSGHARDRRRHDRADRPSGSARSKSTAATTASSSS